MLLKLYHKTWTRTLLSPIQIICFFSSIDKLSAIKLQSRWERVDIVSMSGEKNLRIVYLLSESNWSCMSEISDLKNLHFVMMWMYVILIRVEFRFRDDEWNRMNIFHLHNLFIILLRCSFLPLIYNYVIHALVSTSTFCLQINIYNIYMNMDLKR